MEVKLDFALQNSRASSAIVHRPSYIVHRQTPSAFVVHGNLWLLHFDKLVFAGSQSHLLPVLQLVFTLAGADAFLQITFFICG